MKNWVQKYDDNYADDSFLDKEQSKPEQTEGDNTNNSDFKSGEDVYTWLRMHGTMRIPFDAVDKRVIIETIDFFASQQTATLIKQIEEKDKRIEELEEKTKKRNCYKAAQCANTPGGLSCPKDVICPI